MSRDIFQPPASGGDTFRRPAPLRGSRRDVDRRGLLQQHQEIGFQSPWGFMLVVLVLTPFVSQDWQAWRIAKLATIALSETRGL
jgi:hypothetical protein